MTRLYEIAEENGIGIYVGNIPETVSFSVPGYIALDYSLVGTISEERVHAGHELGHCLTGSFYTREDPSYIRKRYENKADRKAIQILIPEAEFWDAVKAGDTEPWQIAEDFDVTPALAAKARYYYMNHNMVI